MARKDTEQYQSYEKDAFDNPPEGPVGVHRGNRPMIVRVTPFIIVLVAAVAAGVLFWSIFSGEAANMFNRRSEQTQTTAQTSQGSSSSSADESASGTASQSSQSATAGESTSAEGTPSQTPSESESAQSTPEESQQVNTNAQITVINGTGVSGYANDRAGVLQNQGFTNVSAANPDATTVLPAQTVVLPERGRSGDRAAGGQRLGYRHRGTIHLDWHADPGCTDAVSAPQLPICRRPVVHRAVFVYFRLK